MCISKDLGNIPESIQLIIYFFFLKGVHCELYLNNHGSRSSYMDIIINRTQIMCLVMPEPGFDSLSLSIKTPFCAEEKIMVLYNVYSRMRHKISNGLIEPYITSHDDARWRYIYSL